MNIINEGKTKVLLADDNKVLVNKKEYKENPNSEILYYFNKAYIPPTLTIEQVEELYEEVEIGKISNIENYPEVMQYLERED